MPFQDRIWEPPFFSLASILVFSLTSSHVCLVQSLQSPWTRVVWCRAVATFAVPSGWTTLPPILCLGNIFLSSEFKWRSHSKILKFDIFPLWIVSTLPWIINYFCLSTQLGWEQKFLIQLCVPIHSTCLVVTVQEDQHFIYMELYEFFSFYPLGKLAWVLRPFNRKILDCGPRFLCFLLFFFSQSLSNRPVLFIASEEDIIESGVKS